MKNRKLFYILNLFIFLAIFLSFFENEINSQSNISPKITDNGIYFRYINPTANKVYLKSSFDNWSYRYAFYKKDNNVWELRLPTNDPLYQLKKGEYEYRYIVDGVITYDKLNQNKKKDGFGVPISVLEVPYDMYDYTHSPINIKEDIYRFFAFSDDIKTFEIAGSFNNFVPEEMDKNEFRPDLYYKDINLSKGTYYYSFIRDGQWEIDYNNDSVVVDLTGRRLSKVNLNN